MVSATTNAAAMEVGALAAELAGRTTGPIEAILTPVRGKHGMGAAGTHSKRCDQAPSSSGLLRALGRKVSGMPTTKARDRQGTGMLLRGARGLRGMVTRMFRRRGGHKSSLESLGLRREMCCKDDRE